MVDTVQDSLDALNRLDTTLTDRTDAMLEYMELATQDLTKVLDTTITMLERVDIRREMNNLPKTFIPIMIPLIILLIELAITNAY